MIKLFHRIIYLQYDWEPTLGRNHIDASNVIKLFHLDWSYKISENTHTGEKPYRYNQVDQTFSQKNLLTIHLRTHTLKKPHRSNQCDKDFSLKKHLTTHQRTCWGETIAMQPGMVLPGGGLHPPPFFFWSWSVGQCWFWSWSKMINFYNFLPFFSEN